MSARFVFCSPVSVAHGSALRALFHSDLASFLSKHLHASAHQNPTSEYLLAEVCGERFSCSLTYRDRSTYGTCTSGAGHHALWAIAEVSPATGDSSEPEQAHKIGMAPSLEREPVTTTWSFTLDEIEPDAKALMQIIVLFNTDDVPYDLLLPSDPSHKCVISLAFPSGFYS